MANVDCSPSPSMQQGLGFLAVSSSPSPLLPINQFHEWYEEEHIPLRFNQIKEFLSGARYKGVSRQGQEHEVGSTRSSWLALYTVTSPATFTSSVYRGLRENRSERERDVMSRIEVMKRITGEIIGSYPNEEKMTGFHPGRPPSDWIVTHGVDVRSGGEIELWEDQIKHEILNKFSARSTLLVRVIESGVTRFAKTVEADEEVTTPYFVVHEFTDRESAESFLQLDGFDGIEIGEKMMWELYKAYPSRIQGEDG